MSIRNFEKLFRPQSVALIGASERPGSVGAVVARNLRHAGFEGELLLVNPHLTSLDGAPVYRDIAGLPHPPDLAIIATPPDTVPGLVAELGARGVRAAVVITAGFGELGERGLVLQRAMLDAARPYLLRLIGPNCVGLIVPGIGLDASFAHLAPPAGDIAFVSQSGAMITAMLDWAAPRGIGFSHVVSLGDMADVDFGDMLDWLATEQSTRAILLYAEGITHGRKFMSAARAAARLKPVLVLKAGRSQAGARAAASHTGVLAGSDRVYRRRVPPRRHAARQYNGRAVRCGRDAGADRRAERRAARDPDQWRRRRRAGNRCAGSAGRTARRIIARDDRPARRGAAADLEPRQPGRHHRRRAGTRYAAALDALFADDGVDAVLVAELPDGAGGSGRCGAGRDRGLAVATRRGAARPQHVHRLAWRRSAADRRARCSTPPACRPTKRPRRRSPRCCTVVRYQRNQALLMESPPARPEADAADPGAARTAIAAALAAGRAWLDPAEIEAVLAAYRIPRPQSRLAADPERPPLLPRRSGFPVALKIRSPDIIHKSDVGGIALDLGDAGRCARRAAAMLARIAQRTARRPGSTGFSCSRWCRPPARIELLAGIADDPVFGPVILFGQGGTAVEIIDDSASPCRRSICCWRAPRWRARGYGGCCRAIATSRRPRSMRSPKC